MAPLSADLGVTQQSIYSLHLIHGLRGWDGTQAVLSGLLLQSCLMQNTLTAANEWPRELKQCAAMNYVLWGCITARVWLGGGLTCESIA